MNEQRTARVFCRMFGASSSVLRKDTERLGGQVGALRAVGGLVRRGHRETVLGGFHCVEDGAAMPADGDAGLQFFPAGGAIHHAHGNVSPFAFNAQRDGSAAMQIGNFAEGMTACPHGVAVGNQAVVESVAARGGSGEFFGGGPRPGTDEDAVIVQILQEVVGDFAGADGEWEAAVVTQIESVAARGDEKQSVGRSGCAGLEIRAGCHLGFRASRDVIHAVGARNVPILVGDGSDGDSGRGVALGARVNQCFAASAGDWSGASGVFYFGSAIQGSVLLSWKPQYLSCMCTCNIALWYACVHASHIAR